MRVTRQMMDRQTLEAIRENMTGLKDVNRQMTSGERIATMSDDVGGSSELMRANRLKDTMATHQKNIDHGKDVMSRGATALEDASEQLNRALELSVQGANGSYTKSDLQGMAEEVDGTLEQLVSGANEQFGGRYIFGGRKTGTKPFVAERGSEGQIVGVTYEGAGETTKGAVSPNQSVRMNLNGADLYKSAGDTFNTLVEIRDAMQEGDQEAVREMIPELRRNHEGINVGAAELGSEINGLKAIEKRLEGRETDNDDTISDLNDTDMAEASMEYQRYMSALQSAMQFASKANANSLLDLM